MPVLTAGAYWDGKVPENTAWRDDEKLFALVPGIVDRDTPDADALARLNRYVDTIPADQRAAALPRLFSAIVDETNDQRTRLIQRYPAAWPATAASERRRGADQRPGGRERATIRTITTLQGNGISIFVRFRKPSGRCATRATRR